MEDITLPIYSREGKEVDTIKLNPSVFDGTIHSAAIYQAVNAFRARQRKGLAATKTRGEVSGGGRKPWRQKGTGRARVGSIRSPLWRHGGVIFGPHPRDFSYTIPKKLQRLALKSVLCAKIKENNFIVLDSLNVDKPKTKEVAAIFHNLKIPQKSVLLLLDKIDNNLKLSLNNLDFLTVNMARDTYAYQVLAARKVIATKDGLNALTERLKG